MRTEFLFTTDLGDRTIYFSGKDEMGNRARWVGATPDGGAASHRATTGCDSTPRHLGCGIMAALNSGLIRPEPARSSEMTPLAPLALARSGAIIVPLRLF